jgi:ketosteroid isomerase-like protein
MNAGARTPEELETLFEDTLILRDHQALARLFEDGAVLVVDDERSAYGAEDIARLALATWEGDHTYVANPLRVIQVRDIALVVSAWDINVMRRDSDGIWRYTIVRQSVDDASRRTSVKSQA